MSPSLLVTCRSNECLLITLERERERERRFCRRFWNETQELIRVLN